MGLHHCFYAEMRIEHAVFSTCADHRHVDSKLIRVEVERILRNEAENSRADDSIRVAVGSYISFHCTAILIGVLDGTLRVLMHSIGWTSVLAQ